MPKTLVVALLSFYMIFLSGCEENRLEAVSVQTRWCSECNVEVDKSNPCSHLKFKLMWKETK